MSAATPEASSSSGTSAPSVGPTKSTGVLLPRATSTKSDASDGSVDCVQTSTAAGEVPGEASNEGCHPAVFNSRLMASSVIRSLGRQITNCPGEVTRHASSAWRCSVDCRGHHDPRRRRDAVHGEQRPS